MKKSIIFFWFLLSLIGFSSCEDAKDPVMNDKALDGSLTFKLNQPVYAKYILEDSTSTKDMDYLTCVQPDYGFNAAVTYSVQVSFGSTFTPGTFETLPTSVNGEKVGLNVKEMDKAMIALYGGSLPDPVVEKKVYIRLKAVISSAINSQSSDSLIVKPVYSNAISLKITPYVLPLFPYTEVSPKLWYIIGLGGKWDNSVAGLGSSLIPMSIQNGKKYNLNGDGEFIYTGYFKASDGFKILKNIKDWNNDIWGKTGNSFVYNGGGNISVPSDGYYIITLNSIDKTLKIEPTTLASTPPEINSVGLIGAFNSWAADVTLTPNAGASNHIWYTTYTFVADYQCKLRANAGWDLNWGTPASNDGDPLYSSMGVAKKGGKNMIETAGTYTIILNDLDGVYYFIKQ